jgi:hypothetical protein
MKGVSIVLERIWLGVSRGDGGGTVVRAAFLVGLVSGYVKDFALFWM